MKKIILILTLLAFNLSAEEDNNDVIETTVTTSQEFREALVAAARNNQDDIIKINAVTLKTIDETTDDLGTVTGIFEYKSKEDFSLTIESLHSETPAILDGNNTHPILLVKSPNTVTIKNIVFQNGKSAKFQNSAALSAIEETDTKDGITPNFNLIIENSEFNENS